VVSCAVGVRVSLSRLSLPAAAVVLVVPSHAAGMFPVKSDDATLSETPRATCVHAEPSDRKMSVVSVS